MSTNPYESAPLGIVERYYYYQPTRSLVTWISVVFIGNAIVETVMAIALFWIDPYLQEEFAAENVSDDQLVALGLAIGGLSCIFVIMYIVGVVLFCRFVYLSNANARALGAKGMEYTPGWSVGWYFIPIMNLFKPYQAMKEIYRASDPDSTGFGWKATFAPGLLLAWWLTWVVTNVIGQVDFRLTMREDPISQQASLYVGAVGAAVTWVAVFLALGVVRAISSRQEEKYARRSKAIPPVVAPVGGNPWQDVR